MPTSGSPNLASCGSWPVSGFPEETLRDIEEQGQELFGENWPHVKYLLAELERYQIYYMDPKPKNIVF